MNLHRNAIYLTIEKAVHVLGGLLGMVMVARSLGGDTLADYGFAISLTAFFIPFLDLGMNNRIIKSVAGGADLATTLNVVIAYKMTLAPVVFGAMFLGGVVWGESHVSVAVALIGLSTIAMSMGDSASSVFKGLHRSHISCWMITGLTVLLLGSLAFSLHAGGGLAAVAWCYAGSRLVYCVIAYAILARQYRPSLRVRLGFSRQTVREGLLHLPGVYFLGSLLYLTYLSTYVLAPAEAGVFYVGYRAAAALYILVSAGFEAVLASAVKGETSRGVLGFGFVIYSLVSLLILFLVAPLATVIFGDEYAGSVRPIRLLASCVPSFALCGLAYTLLLASRNEGFATAVMTALLAGGFGLAVGFESLYGAETTAFAPAIASTVAMLVLWVGLSRRTSRDTTLA